MNSIRLRSPGDVVAVLPYQLGYHPHESLVVVALRDRAVVLVQRVDLPTAAEADEACRVLVPPLLREGPEAVLLVAYETRAGDGRPGLDAVRRELVGAGVQVLDRIVVRGDRWFAVDCATGCCPPDGSPVPSPAHTPAVAEFVGLGISPLPGRGALAAVVAADPERASAVGLALRERAARRGGLGQAAKRLEALSAWAVALGVRDATSDHASLVDSLRPDQVALLVDSLRDVQLRDGLVAWLCPGSLPQDCLPPDVVDAVRTCLPGPHWPEGARRTRKRDRRPRGRDEAVVGRRHLLRLQHLVRAVPDEHAAAPLTVLANLAWWLGDGALARTCLERALDASPDYRLALLLEQMLDLGIRPRGRAPRTDDPWAGELAGEWAG